MEQFPISLRIQAVTIATHDPEKLAEFYQKAFNFKAAKYIGKGKDHLGIELENFYLGFDRIKEKPKKDGPGGPIIWFSVTNVEEAFKKLIAAGARVYSDVNKEERPGEALAVLYDPDGNLFGLVGPSAAPRE